MCASIAAAGAQTVLSTHPRIWLIASRLLRLKSYAAENTLRWQKLKASADWYLTVDPTPNPLLYLAGAKNCAVVYQVTGNPIYAQAALRFATFFAIPSNTLGDGFDYRDTFPNITFALDWCYDQATPAQRKQLETWLMDRADALWPETNPYAGNRWAVADAGNNYFWGYMYDLPAALACYGDDPRAAIHAQLGLIKYRTVAQPYLNSYGLGGIFSEGTNYDSTMYLGEILDGYDTATGQDLINEPGSTFLHDSLYWRIYGSTPDKAFSYPMGAQSRVPSSPLFDYDRWRANVVYSNTTDTTLASYTKDWLDTITPNISSLDGVLADEFLYYDETHASLDYTATLPTNYYAPGMGFLTNRSDWSNTATYWGIWAGPNFEAHEDQDVNGFEIWKGGWLAGNDSVWSSDGTLGQTIYHNNLTFGGLQQTWQGPDASYPDQGGRCQRHEVGKDYTYFAGQGAQSYVQNHNDPIPPVKDYVRKYAWISPDLFFIFDRATVTDPTMAKEWHLHSLNPIAISGRGYRFDNGSYEMIGQSLLPTTGVTLSTQPVIYKDVAPSSYRLDVVTANDTATDYMLNVLQVAPLGSHGAAAQTVIASTGNMEGAACNNWVVMFGKVDRIINAVTYTVPAGTTYQNLVLDQVPNLHYTVSNKNSQTGVTTITAGTASASGSLRFAAPGGAVVTVSTTDAIPLSITGRVTNSLDGRGIFGATVTCAGATSITDTSGLYFLTGLSAGTYYVSVNKPNYQFTATQTATLGPTRTNLNFQGRLFYATSYMISGTVTCSGQGVPGVAIAAGGQSAVTGANGVYMITGVPAGTWVVNASVGAYTVSYPQLATVGPNATGVNFTATWIGFDIYGTITCNGSGLAGVTTTTGGKSVVTLADGTYIITGLPAGSYSVTASDSGYTLSGAQPATLGPYGATGVNFTAAASGAPSTYAISGVVTYNSAGLAGVTVKAGQASAVTASDGTYTITALAAGTYTVAASESGYILSGSHSVAVGPNASGINFTASVNTQPTYTISGLVSGPKGVLSGALVSAGGYAATTSSTGAYTIIGMAAGAYQVTPSSPGYAFGPSRPVTLGPNQTGINFTGTVVVTIPGALRVNCGGPAYASASGTWQADEYFAAGAPYAFQGLTVTGTTDPVLLQTMRFGYSDFSYTLPAAPGPYSLKLYFVEGDSRALVPGTRLFDVLVNGTRVLASLDVCKAAGGLGIALVESIPVTAGSSGSVVVTFHPMASSAIVSAIELYPPLQHSNAGAGSPQL